MDINKIQDKIIQEFGYFADKVERFKYFRQIVHLGNQVPAIAMRDKNETTIVKGCKNKVWMKAYFKDGKVFYETDSENPITKGIASLLSNVFSGHTPKEIINSNLYFLNEINLYDKLNAAWTKEVQSILQRMKSLAINFKNTSFAI